MRKKVLRLLRSLPLALLFVATVASAQTTGTVIGVVTDAATGKPVVGALVIATSPNMPGEQTTVTDEGGSFRISQLPPGQYKLAVQVQGYKPAERSDIALRVDKTLRANMAVVPEAVQMEEQVVRTGLAPVINVGSAETGSVVSREFMSTIPVGRQVSGLAIVAPTATSDIQGIGFAGSQSLENGYILDGVQVADPRYGGQGTNPISEFVQEVDIKTGAFMPEYGRAGGGIVNIVTQSGSNEFHGSIFGDLNPSWITSPDGAPSGRTGASVYQMSHPGGGAYDSSFGAKVGGPIVKDKVWFFAGFAPILNKAVFDRYVMLNQIDPVTGAKMKDANGNYIQTKIPGSDQNVPSQYNNYQFLAKLSYLVDENNNLTLSFLGNPSTSRGLFRNGPGSASPVNTFLSIYEQNASAYNGDWNQNTYDAVAKYTGKFADKRVIVEGMGGLHSTNFSSILGTVNGIPQTNAVIRWGSSPMSAFETAPQACSDTSGMTTPAAVAGYLRNACSFGRYYSGGYDPIYDYTTNTFDLRAAVSWLVSAGKAGSMNIKAGADYEGMFDDSTTKRSNNALGGVLYDFGPSSATPGNELMYLYRNYGYVGTGLPGASFYGSNPVNGTDFHMNAEVAKVASTSFSLYLQDSWSILSNLTLNFGVRWETQSMKNNAAAADAPQKTSFSINDNIAPRVQLIWDPTNQGRAKVAGNWGRFYNMIPLDMGIRSFGSETSVVGLYSCPNVVKSATANVSPLDSNSLCTAVTPSSPDWGAAGITDLNDKAATLTQNGAVSPVAPDLKGIYMDSFGAQAEYELINDLSVGVEWAARRLGRTIEDMSSNNGVTYFIANPGESSPWTPSIPGYGQANPLKSTTTDVLTGRTVVFDNPKPQRDYDGFTLKLTKNYSKHWLAQASYTYSVLRGNYSGPIFPEYAGGQTDPYITAAYDLPYLLTNGTGLLAGNVTHYFRAYGSYVWDISPRFQVTGGGGIRIQSGAPISATGAQALYGEGFAFLVPRGSAGTAPTVTNLDLLGGFEYALSGPYRLRFTLNLFNILNQTTATAIDNNSTFDFVAPITNASCKNKNGANAANPIQGVQADCPDLKYAKTLDGRPVTPNERYGKGTQFQAPFSMRVGLALTF